MIRETHVLGGPWKNGLLPLGIAPQVGEYLNSSPQRGAQSPRVWAAPKIWQPN